MIYTSYSILIFSVKEIKYLICEKYTRPENIAVTQNRQSLIAISINAVPNFK